MQEMAGSVLQSSSASMNGMARLVENHTMVTTEQRKNCALCYQTGGKQYGQRKTVTFCVQCCAALHKDCFNKWHRDEFPISSHVAPK